MNFNSANTNMSSFLNRRPTAQASMVGAEQYSGVQGVVRFYQTAYGTLVVAEIVGLPDGGTDCESPIFAMHIHEGGDCTGTLDDPFANVGGHYNPQGCPHPYHAGDLLPLFSANGYGFSAFLTDRFSAREIVGRAVIIHARPDDFSTQPAGNAGDKIACGVIRG